MRGALHDIDGVKAYIQQNSPATMAKLRRIISEQARDVAIDRVEVGTVWNGEPWIDYHLRDQAIRITVGKGHKPGQLASILERNRSAIESYRRSVTLEPEIDVVDALLALRFAGRAQLLAAGRPFDGKLRITVPQGDYAESLTRPTAEIKFAGGRILRTGRRITTTLWSGSQTGLERQSWDNRSLLITMRETIPQAVVIAMAGKPLDDIVSDTILAGTGSVVKKAWQIGGRIGFSFAPRLVSLRQALEMDPRVIARAA